MKREDDEKLWDLLGKSAEPKISPFFARNVLREVRESERRSRVSGWLVPAAGVAVAIIAALFVRVQTPDSNYSESRAETLTFIESQDSELIADLDDLIESDDNNSWDDSVLL